jgi:hypothetical protein
MRRCADAKMLGGGKKFEKRKIRNSKNVKISPRLNMVQNYSSTARSCILYLCYEYQKQ